MVQRIVNAGWAVLVMVAGGVFAITAAATLTMGAAGQVHAKPIRILALGDSLTAGYELSPRDAFPAQLERALKARGHDVVVQNAGVSGDTTAAGLARLDWALSDDPDAAIVALGANDMLRALDPAEPKSNLDAILTRLNADGVPVLLAGMYASDNLGRSYTQRFNAIYPDLAERHGAILYPFFLEGIALDPTLNLPDLIHPNPNGVAVMVRNILPYVERLIERVE